MDPLRSVFILGLLMVITQVQSAVPTSMQSVDKNDPAPVQGPKINYSAPPPSAAPTAQSRQEGGAPSGTTEAGGVPVGQFTKSKSKASSVGGVTAGEAGQASVSQAAPTGEAGSVSFTPIGMTGSGNTWAEALGYSVPASWEVAKPVEPQGFMGWAESSQTTPTTIQQATPTDPLQTGEPVGGGAVGGVSPMNGLVGGDTGGLFGGTGGANDIFNLGSGGLLGGASTSAGGGLFGGGAESGLLGGLMGGADGLLGGMGGMGGMGGLFGQSAGGAKATPFGFGRGSSRQGEMMKTMLLMQLMAGGDAPDPPANPTGRAGARGGRARRPVAGPMVAMEQLMRLERINAIRQQQIERAMRNRMRPENQGSSNQGARYPPGPGGFGPPTATGPDRGAFHSPGMRNSPHPEALNRQNVQFRATVTPGGQGQGPEPVEREPAAGAQGARDPAVRRRGQRQRRQWSDAAPPVGPDMPGTVAQDPVPTDYPPMRSTPPMFNRATQQMPGMTGRQDPMTGQQQSTMAEQQLMARQQGFQRSRQHSMMGQQHPMMGQRQPMAGQQGFRPSRLPSRNNVPRNMNELMADPRFQRRLRLNTRPTPTANSADVRADRADRMADYMDNMQSMNPLARMMMGGRMPGMPGIPGLAGMAGIPGMTGMGLPGMIGMGIPGMGGDMMGLGGLLGLAGGALPGSNALSGRGGISSQMPSQRVSAQADLPGRVAGDGPGGVPVGGATGESLFPRPRSAQRPV